MVEGRGDTLKSSCPPFLFDDSELSFCSHFSAELSAWAQWKWARSQVVLKRWAVSGFEMPYLVLRSCSRKLPLLLERLSLPRARFSIKK